MTDELTGTNLKKDHQCEAQGCDKRAVCVHDVTTRSDWKSYLDYYCAEHDPDRRKLLDRKTELEETIQRAHKEIDEIKRRIVEMDKR